MKLANKLGMTGIVFSLLLTACVQTPTSPDTAETAVKENVKAAAEVARQSNNKAPAEDYATVNPVVIAFDKMSVKLDDADRQIIAQISERAKKTNALVITGFCDRKQVGNAKAAALARAGAVREELIDLGVKPNKVRMKYVTEIANKHAVEIQF